MAGRGLDHIVHAVKDLDAAADLYRRMGFTVGARNKHPWGTHNLIVQLPGFFIELLTVAEPEKLGDDGFSKLFGAYNQGFLQRGEGLSLLVLESKDAAADKETFAEAGISMSGVMRFEREGKRPDGSTVKVAFSLTFAKDADAPNIHFCTCQQHYPENFWNPAFQRHDNGAEAVRGAIMVAADAGSHRDFASTFTGSSEFYTESGEVSVMLPRGSFSVMTPERFVAAFGGPLPPPSPRLQAIRFGMADIARARNALRGVKYRDHPRGGFVVDATEALGAVLSFEAPRH